MEHSELHFKFKARYYKLGEVTSATHAIWIVLHGYGQLAQYFIRNFSSLQDQNIVVIAPEALSRFYLHDVQSRVTSGDNRVGASWMTREYRETDIENYLTYLDALYHQVAGQSQIPVTVLGFSQGAATASRWVLEGKIKFDRLILWAGILPPDMNFIRGSEILKDKNVTFVYGNKDPFINDKRFSEMKNLAEKLSINPVTIEFEGEHKIDIPTLKKLL